MIDENNENKIVLADSVRVFFNGWNEIRIRKGIWNYEEAVLSLEEIGERLKDAFIKFFNLLNRGTAINVDTFFEEEEQLSLFEKTQFRQVLDALFAQNYIHTENDFIGKHLLYDLIGGEMAGTFYKPLEEYKPVLFFADSQSVIEYAKLLSKQIFLPIEVMSSEKLKEIAGFDLTARMEGFDTRTQLDELINYLEPYCCVVGCMERPHISFLRNLNRALIKTSQVLSMALLDGPFTSVFTIKPPETGCFECYENRLLARMQDMSVYQKFVEHGRKHPVQIKEKTFATPIMHSLVSQVIFEGFLVASIGKSKLAGRALNTYLPIMEIQVQDLLRVPFCPACGFVSQSQMTEMYTSTKKIVDKVIDQIVIDDQ